MPLDGSRVGDAGEVEEPRNRRPEGVLVQPPDAPQEVDSPGLLGVLPKPQRLERDRHLHLPAAIGTQGAHMPHAVPVAVELPSLVENLPIELGAGGVRLEHVAVPPVVERVQQHPEDVARAGREVPREVVHDHPVRVVVSERAEVKELVVVEHPHLGLEGRRHPLVRVALRESRSDRRSGPLVFIEDTVDPDRLGRPHRRQTALETHGLEVHRLLGKGPDQASGTAKGPRRFPKAEAGLRPFRGAGPRTCPLANVPPRGWCGVADFRREAIRPAVVSRPADSRQARAG